MDGYEKLGYLCLGVVAACYLAAMLLGVIAAFPFGLRQECPSPGPFCLQAFSTPGPDVTAVRSD